MRTLRLVAVCLAFFVALAISGSTGAAQTDLGWAAKRPVVAASCKMCPWGALAEILKQSMVPQGYDLQICHHCATVENARYVGDARVPALLATLPEARRRILQRLGAMNEAPQAPVDMGVTMPYLIWHAYHGTGVFAKDKPRQNLRLLASTETPSYLLIAATKASGVTDLRQIRDERKPVRILVQWPEFYLPVLEYYGITEKDLKSWGGALVEVDIEHPEERKNFDVAISVGALTNVPEFDMWYAITQTNDLTFLEPAPDLVAKMASDLKIEPRILPVSYFRGVDRPIRTVGSGTHYTASAIYARADTPDDAAYAIVKGLDENRQNLLWGLQPFVYDSRTVWKFLDVPLHPGAARYYREVGYMK